MPLVSSPMPQSRRGCLVCVYVTKKDKLFAANFFVFSMVSSAMPQSRRGSRTIASCTDIVICLPRNACLLLSWAKIPGRTEIPVSNFPRF